MSQSQSQGHELFEFVPFPGIINNDEVTLSLMKDAALIIPKVSKILGVDYSFGFDDEEEEEDEEEDDDGSEGARAKSKKAPLSLQVEPSPSVSKNTKSIKVRAARSKELKPKKIVESNNNNNNNNRPENSQKEDAISTSTTTKKIPPNKRKRCISDSFALGERNDSRRRRLENNSAAKKKRRTGSEGEDEADNEIKKKLWEDVNKFTEQIRQLNALEREKKGLYEKMMEKKMLLLPASAGNASPEYVHHININSQEPATLPPTSN